MKPALLAALFPLLVCNGTLAASAANPPCADAVHAALFDRVMHAARSDDIDELKFQDYLDEFMLCERSRG